MIGDGIEKGGEDVSCGGEGNDEEEAGKFFKSFNFFIFSFCFFFLFLLLLLK